MEVFLWLWLLDKRWLCGYRPILRYYLLLWFFPCLMNSILLTINIYYISHSLYINNESQVVYQYYILIKSILSLISIICSLLLVRDLIANQHKEYSAFNEILLEYNKEEKKKDFMSFIEDEYWKGRKCLLNINGKILLLVGIGQIISSLYYLKNHNNYIYYVDYSMKHCSSIEVIFALPIIIIFGLSFLIKLLTFILSYTCPCVIISFSGLFSKTKYHRKIDFSDIKNYKV